MFRLFVNAVIADGKKYSLLSRDILIQIFNTIQTQLSKNEKVSLNFFCIFEI